MQKYVHLADLVKSFQTNIYLSTCKIWRRYSRERASLSLEKMNKLFNPPLQKNTSVHRPRHNHEMCGSAFPALPKESPARSVSLVGIFRALHKTVTILEDDIEVSAIVATGAARQARSRSPWSTTTPQPRALRCNLSFLSLLSLFFLPRNRCRFTEYVFSELGRKRQVSVLKRKR